MNDDDIESSDLSAYEKRRLANIRRNNAMLKQLGLEVPKVRSAQPKKRKRKKPPAPVKKEATRRSKRLRGCGANAGGQEGLSDADSTEAAVDSDDGAVDYESIPVDPERLDDHEFEVYAALRKWRLSRKRELDIEAYKVSVRRPGGGRALIHLGNLCLLKPFLLLLQICL